MQCTSLFCSEVEYSVETTVQYDLHLLSPCFRKFNARLHATALHCNALSVTALHCTALNCTALYFTELHCSTLHCQNTDLNFSALHSTELHIIHKIPCNKQHYPTLYCNSLCCNEQHCVILLTHT